MRQELHSDDLQMVSITGVEVSPDLRHARVFVSSLGEEEDLRRAVAALVRGRQQIQFGLGENLDLRYVPQLQFVPDRTAAQAQEVESLLFRIAEEPPLAATEEEAPRDEEGD
jgi:ribosome-binding factor A